ncbi:MAG: hypothetical protein DRH34_05775, partial [Deltaproteobacteria bacterium]
IVDKSITIERRNRAPTTMHMGGECETHEDCMEKYGLGWFCEKECVDWDWDALHNCLRGCEEQHVACELACQIEPTPFCEAACLAAYIGCTLYCYNTHCIEWEGKCVQRW